MRRCLRTRESPVNPGASKNPRHTGGNSECRCWNFETCAREEGAAMCQETSAAPSRIAGGSTLASDSHRVGRGAAVLSSISGARKNA